MGQEASLLSGAGRRWGRSPWVLAGAGRGAGARGPLPLPSPRKVGPLLQVEMPLQRADVRLKVPDGG